jgi:hypothetical protein
VTGGEGVWWTCVDSDGIGDDAEGHARVQACDGKMNPRVAMQ